MGKHITNQILILYKLVFVFLAGLWWSSDHWQGGWEIEKKNRCCLILCI